jgi:hypothetical protein
MKPLILAITLCASFALGTAAIGAKPPTHDANGVETPNPDAKKKPAGAECASSIECRHHHRCQKDGNKKVCTPLPSHLIPPT